MSKYFLMPVLFLIACAGKANYTVVEELIQMREYNMAIELLQPTHPLLGRLYILAGRYEEALTEDLSPYQLGFVYQRLGMYKQAIKSYLMVSGILFENAIYNSGISASKIGDTLSAILYFQKAGGFRDSDRLLARLYHGVGRDEEALALWREIDDGEALYRLGEYREMIDRYPSSLFALKALEKIEVCTRTKVDVLLENRRFGSALEYITDHRLRGDALFGLGRYVEAASEYRKAGARLNAGRALDRAGRDDEALKEYLASGTSAGYFRAAQLYEREGNIESAIKTYKKAYPHRMAALRRGLLLFEKGELEEALAAFENTYPVVASYWMARVTGLDYHIASVMRQGPLSYYAYLLGGEIEIADIYPAEWIAQFSDTVYSLSPEDSLRLLRGKMLLDYGIRGEARRELLGIKNRNPLLIYRLALLASQGGIDKTAIGFASRVLRIGEPPYPRELLMIAYPLSYLPTILLNEKRNPFLFKALIREESRFHHRAVSRCDALGLTQVIPSTGRGIARELGKNDFTPEWLKDPDINIKFGVHYFHYCLERFGGVLEHALSAYNAGPTVTARWIDDSPMDIWVERIPFTETRRYVKRVLGSYNVYRQLYDLEMLRLEDWKVRRLPIINY